ncbi:hypothetical protein RFI_09443, partial [Reticulomyxa filosa]
IVGKTEIEAETDTDITTTETKTHDDLHVEIRPRRKCMDWYVWDGTSPNSLTDFREILKQQEYAAHFSFPIGGFVNVHLVSDNNTWIQRADDEVTVGTWVFLNDIKVLHQTSDSSLKLEMDDASTFAKTSSSDKFVRERLSHVYYQLGSCNIVTKVVNDVTTNEFYTPVSSIKQTYLPDLTYKIRGKVISCEPNNVSSFIIQKGSSIDIAFIIKVQDSSDTLKIIVNGSAAELFLGIKATDFHSKYSIVSKKMNAYLHLRQLLTYVCAAILFRWIKIGCRRSVYVPSKDCAYSLTFEKFLIKLIRAMQRKKTDEEVASKQKIPNMMGYKKQKKEEEQNHN